MNEMATIVVSSNTCWSVFNFRLELIREFASTHRVVILAPNDLYTEKLIKLGFEVYHIPMASSSIDLFIDIKTIISFYSTIRRIRPDYFLGFTAKPNVFGGAIASWLGVKVINNIAGLGRTFSSKSFLRCVMIFLYRIGLLKSHHIFFQNYDDYSLFLKLKLVSTERASVLPGSGVNLSRFIPISKKDISSPFTFLFSSRLLLEKGIVEYISAARIVKSKFPDIHFMILGKYSATPAEIGRHVLDSAIADGIIDYLGVTDDIVSVLHSVQCFVLPSYYREGVPRSLLEAGSCGLPLLTTDSVGCRETVVHEVNGFLVEPRSISSLTQAMIKMIEMPTVDRIAMGNASRKFIEQIFDERIVLERYSDLIG